MKLYSSPASPYGRKVSITAIETGLADRITEVAIAVAPTTPNHDYAVQNPLMKIPALALDDGATLYDSIVICEYLDALAGTRLFPRDGDTRWDALRRNALADGVLDAAVLVRYETVARPEALRWQAWIDGQYDRIDHALDAAERDAAHPPAALDIGQIATACALGYLDFRFAARPWRPGRPALAAWFGGISQRPAVARTVPAG